VLEEIATGGASPNKLENRKYLGFPTGLSDAELAERATLQAEKFGARFSIPSQAAKLGSSGLPTTFPCCTWQTTMAERGDSNPR
jgi:thioredoxin reductase (NADPH)